jgi:hypothetical protein
MLVFHECVFIYLVVTPKMFEEVLSCFTEYIR